MKFWDVTVLLIFLTLCHNLSDGSSRHGRENHHTIRQIRNLRTNIDKIRLRQRTDQIHLSSLEKHLENLSKKIETALLPLAGTLGLPEGGADTEFHSSEPEETKFQESSANKGNSHNQILPVKRQLELETQDLRSNGGRGEKALDWLLKIVPDLQDNIRELQESTDILQDMRRNRVTDAKVSSLEGLVNSFQNTSLGLVAKVEAAYAAVNALNAEEELRSKLQRNALTKIASLEEKLQEHSETLDSILKVLPDGVFKYHKKVLLSEIFETKEDGATRDELAGKINELEFKMSSIDFALMKLQTKVLSGESASLLISGNTSEVPENFTGSSSNLSDMREMTERLAVIENEMSGLRATSTSIITLLEDVERTHEQIKSKMIEYLSSFEAKLDKEREDRLVNENSWRTSRMELEVEEHTDFYEFKQIFNSLSKRVRKLESDQKRKFLETKKDTSETDSDYLQMQINFAVDRITKLERLLLEKEELMEWDGPRSRKIRRRSRDIIRSKESLMKALPNS